MHPDEGFEKFTGLFEKYKDSDALFNEADTRAKLIDIILKDCLGWDEDNISREDNLVSGKTDYQLKISGICYLVVEAKKEGDYFNIPTTGARRSYKIDGSISSSHNLLDAMNQVRGYCNDIGCKFAAVFNGHQVVIFSAITIGKPWTQGYCIVFRSLSDIKNNFNYFWNLLSKDNLSSGSLIKYLEKGRRNRIFNKILDNLHNPDQTWARNELYTYIQPISDLVFSELLDEAKSQVLKSCYIFDRSSTTLTTELESFFEDKLPHFKREYKIEDIIEKELQAGTFQEEFLKRTQNDVSGSLTVLLGGVGCGKTTFLHRFFKIVLADKESLIWFYIDYRKASPNQNEIENYTLNRMYEQWIYKYKNRFDNILADLGFSVEPDDLKSFLSKLFRLLSKLKFSIALIIDNVDQHDSKFQENLFLFSNHITELLKTVTIVALREETFISSSRSGVFTAYYVPKFHLGLTHN
jgi:hypothetical protein